MNKSIVLTAFGLVTALGGGGVVGYFVGKKLQETRNKAMIDSANAAAQELYELKYGKVEPQEPEKNKVTGQHKMPVTETSSIVKPTVQEQVNYAKLAGQYASSSTVMAPKPLKNPEDIKIYIIEADEFNADDGVQQNTLIYYQDGYVTDEDDNICNNYAELIGNDFVKEFQGGKMDAFVMNENIGQKFYIEYRKKNLYSFPKED